MIFGVLRIVSKQSHMVIATWRSIDLILLVVCGIFGFLTIRTRKWSVCVDFKRESAQSNCNMGRRVKLKLL